MPDLDDDLSPAQRDMRERLAEHWACVEVTPLRSDGRGDVAMSVYRDAPGADEAPGAPVHTWRITGDGGVIGGSPGAPVDPFDRDRWDA